jgi:hypothetical protein
MFGLISGLLYAMKAVVCIEEKYSSGVQLNFGQYLIFAIGWFGMKPSYFTKLNRHNSLSGWSKLILEGCAFCMLGSILFCLSKFIFYTSNIVGIILALISLSLILHFGIITITAGLWRYKGINCHKLFISPWKSKSLSEFWGQRWNLAFVEMITIGIFRPVSSKLGKNIGTILSFLCSGLFHEVALSLPVKAGYGLPTLYFLIQSLLIIIDQRIGLKHFKYKSNLILNKLWLIIRLLIFSPLLFHEKFIKEVLIPILQH